MLSMIIGVLGKGGSGKTTVSTQLALALHERSSRLLAVDADHNMDFAFNLTGGEIPSSMRFISGSLPAMREHVGLPADAGYADALLSGSTARFRLSPPDPVTHLYATSVRDGMLLMAAGPQTDDVLYGKSCSHSLTTPLKVYLPLLDLASGETVVVDEKAGADGVSTGIVTGIDVAVIVCEAAVHSVKTARQIADLLKFYDTPYLFVVNKAQSESDVSYVTDMLGEQPIAALSFADDIRRHPFDASATLSVQIESVIERCRTAARNDRLERSVRKFTRNKEYQGQ